MTCPEDGPEQVVAALSRALGHVKDQLVEAMAEAQVFAAVPEARPGR